MGSFSRGLTIALAAALFAAPASAEIWQWTDAEGVVRYTPNPDRVPESQRGSLVKVEPGMTAPAPSPSEPPVRYAPPEELPPGTDPFAVPEPARTLESPELPEAPPSTAPELAPGLESPEVPEAEPSATPEPHAAPGEVSTPRTAPVEAPPPRTAPGEASAPPPPRRPLSDAERARRAELEEQIAAAQEALKELISREAAKGDEPLRESPELRELARRLPALQAELRALDGVPERRDERAAREP